MTDAQYLGGADGQKAVPSFFCRAGGPFTKTSCFSYGAKLMNQHLFDELIAMKQRDADTRSRLVREGRLYDGYAEEMQQVHRENAHRLNEVISQHGWPTISLVGLEGCRAAWLIAQHSICTPDLQRRFLALVTEAAENGEVPKAQVAFLIDRIRFNENKPQMYGTVLDWNEQGELSCVVEDPVNLDARRRDMGLPATQDDDLAAHRKEVESEGGKPPRDLAEAKRKRLEWAKSVGWIQET